MESREKPFLRVVLWGVGCALPVWRVLSVWGVPHLSPCLAVVLVHDEQAVVSAGRAVLGHIVDEAPAEPRPVGDVVRAAAPVPALCGRAAAAQGGVARALRHVPRAARAGDRVHQACSHYSIDKRCLFRSWEHRERNHIRITGCYLNRNSPQERNNVTCAHISELEQQQNVFKVQRVYMWAHVSVLHLHISFSAVNNNS